MNKLLYILLLSFFTLSAIGGSKKNNCSKGFGSKKQQLREQQQRKTHKNKSNRNRQRNRRQVQATDQNQRLSPSKDSAASQGNEQNRNAGEHGEGSELTNKLIEEGEGTQSMLGRKATVGLKPIPNTKPYINKEDKLKILEFLNESIEKHPTDIDLYFRRGHVHFSLGNHEKSLSDNEFAINGGSKLLEGYLEVAQSAIFLLNSNKSDINSDQSELLLEKAIRYSQDFLSAVKPNSPNLSQAYYVLARALNKKGKYQESIENYDLALENFSSESTIKTISNLHHSRAQAISNLADQTADSSLAINLYKRAIKDCERAIGDFGADRSSLDATFALKKSITTRMNRLLDSYDNNI